MPLALSKYYVDMNVSSSIKSETKDIVENIRNALIEKIQEIEWLEESTKRYAIDKITKMQFQLGYSDYYMDIKNVYEVYKTLDILEDDYFSILKYKDIQDTALLFYKFSTVDDNIVKRSEQSRSPVIPVMPSYVSFFFYFIKKNIKRHYYNIKFKINIKNIYFIYIYIFCNIDT